MSKKQYVVICKPRVRYMASHASLMMIVSADSAAAAIRVFNDADPADAKYFNKPFATPLVEGDVYYL